MRLLKEKYRNDPIITNITKGISVPKWLEYFYLYLRTVVGKRGIILYYVARDLESVSDPATPLIYGEPYSEEHDSLEYELIFCASHVQ